MKPASSWISRNAWTVIADRRSPRRIAVADRQGGQPLDLAVAVAAEIEPCAVAFVVPAPGNDVEYVPGIERRRRPAKQV
jgi:hypothetical protein